MTATVTEGMVGRFQSWYLGHTGKRIFARNARLALLASIGPEYEPVRYTIAEIDDALRAIGGENAVRIGDSSWSRPLTMLSIASKAWIEGYPEDKHTAILRSALLDLNVKGVLRPHDGVWPDA